MTAVGSVERLIAYSIVDIVHLLHDCWSEKGSIEKAQEHRDDAILRIIPFCPIHWLDEEYR
jgi:hypothetical protein